MEYPDHFTGLGKIRQSCEWLRSRLKQAGTWNRILCFLFFVAALSLFLHMREERVEVVEPNTKSSRYVIAQTAFSFADEDATQILRQQAMRDVGEIYRFDEQQLQDHTNAFSRFLIEDEKWRAAAPHTTFEQMLKGAETLEKTLLKIRFTDNRTLQKMRQLKIPVRYVETISSKESLGDLDNHQSFWQLARDKSFGPSVEVEAQDIILQWFKTSSWVFQQDISLERMLRGKIQDSVPVKMTRVEAGSPIIQPGEKVTMRHLAMVSAMREALDKEQNRWAGPTILGSLTLSLIITLVGLAYFRVRVPEILSSTGKLTLLTTLIILTLLLGKVTTYLLFEHASHLAPLVRYPLFVPIASLLICILIGTEAAFFSSVFLAAIMTLSFASAFEYDRFLAANLIISSVAIVLARRMRKRSQLFSVAARLWLLTLPLILAFNLAEGSLFDPGTFYDFATTGAFLFVITVIVVGILPLLESLFGMLTDITLMQLLDPNHPLLRRLSLEAPGTYQHCLVAGNLAEASARAIGANGLFCRVSTLYHDIGKLFNPHYFTENQLGGFNIHQLLTPRESAQVIMSHVTEGEALARKYRLPPSFIDIIREHHGTTLIYYFYCKQVEQAGNDPSLVDERNFRYKGPKPHTRESAIIMLADSVEATTRSLDEYTEELITCTVHRIFKEKIDEGQLDECRLTFEELSIIKKTLIKTLFVAHHMRIKYPAKSAAQVPAKENPAIAPAIPK